MSDRIVEGARMIAPPVLPAAVSLALAAMVDAAPHPATVLGVGDPAVWIGTADGVLMVATSDAVRLPNSAVVAVPTSARPFAGIEPGDPVLVGDGAIVFDRLRVVARRWFAARPSLPVTEAAAVARRVALLEEMVRPVPDHGLREAFIDDDDRAACEAARLLIGSGDGLTPAGDDLVAGMVAGMLLIGRSIGADGAVEMIERLDAPFMAHASVATTSFSASLLGHAFRGEVATPAAALLMALAGRGDPAAAAADLDAVGHSSGPALTAGVLAGAWAAIERSK